MNMNLNTIFLIISFQMIKLLRKYFNLHRFISHHFSFTHLIDRLYGFLFFSSTKKNCKVFERLNHAYKKRTLLVSFRSHYEMKSIIKKRRSYVYGSSALLGPPVTPALSI